MEKQTTEAILIATFKIQSALHTLDTIEIKNAFKQRKKKELNLLLETLRNIHTHTRTFKYKCVKINRLFHN